MVLVFLQNWRSAIIPLIAVPVAIIGTFAVMAAIGFSLNNLTLFGLVLAIGIVVDDAIVVVEAVEHHIEHGMTPRDATIKAMEQVSGPVIAVGLVLQRRVRAVRVHQRHHRAVLPPVRPDHRRLDDHLGVQLADAQPGPGGHAAAAARDKETHEALPRWRSRCWAAGRLAWLTPWLASWLAAGCGRCSRAPADAAGPRRPGGSSPWLVIAGRSPARLVGWPGRSTGRWRCVFAGFNCGCPGSTTGLHRRRSAAAARQRRGAGGLRRPARPDRAATSRHTPKGFIPPQDMGYLMVNVQLPDAASLERTQQVMTQIAARSAMSTPGVEAHRGAWPGSRSPSAPTARTSARCS